MTVEALERLTNKQRKVLELVDKRRTYKQIAHEMGISEPRVGQHVRNLKNIFDVNDLGQLIDVYREQREPDFTPYSETTSRFLKVPNLVETDNPKVGNDESVFRFEDSQGFDFGTDWVADQDTRLVPEVLDGKLGTLVRVVLMLCVAATGLIVLIVSLAAMVALSDALAQPN